MRTGEKKRWLYVAFPHEENRDGEALYIAADNIQQAMNFAITRNYRGHVLIIRGAVVYTQDAPMLLPLEFDGRHSS